MLFRHTRSLGVDWRPTCSSCGHQFHWNTPFCWRNSSTSGIVCHWMIQKHVPCSCFYPPANMFLLLCRQDHFKCSSHQHVGGKKGSRIFVFYLHLAVFEGFPLCFFHFLENAWDEHRQTSVMAQLCVPPMRLFPLISAYHAAAERCKDDQHDE